MLQARDGVATRMATIRVAASLRRCDNAVILLRWRVELTGYFGEPGRRLRCFAAMAPLGRRRWRAGPG
jgi:hypothetical protein